MEKLDVFIKRLERVGIKVKLGMNVPWVYIDEINGKRVTEKFQAEHGFTVAFLPIKNGAEIKFTNITKIFELLRKYTPSSDRELSVNRESYQRMDFDEFRTRKVFSFFPFIFVEGFEIAIAWTGKWFKFVEVYEQKTKERYSSFDDGWSYQYYWKEWKENWRFVKLK